MFINKNINLKNLFNQKILVSIFFLTYLIIGLYIFKDYGISFDEDIQRIMAQNRIEYIQIFISNFFSLLDNEVKNISIILPEHGVTFELPALIIEKIFGFSDTRSEYLFRHLLIFLTSFIGSFYFFKLVKKRFNSWKIGLIGVFLLITTPRIFAESFYNSKDIIFMYLFTINTYFAIKFLDNPISSNSFYFALFSGLCIGVRVIGIILPIITFYYLWIRFLRNDYKKNIRIKILIFFTSFIFFIILFFPSLWENPLKNFIYSLASFRSYDHEFLNFYLGQYVHPKTIHWYYFPLWIFITTPFIVIIIFIYGLVLSLYRIFNRLIRISKNKDLHDLWRGPIEFYDLFFITFIIAPIFLIIVFKSASYSGWRHLYFIYPFIIIIGLVGLRFFYIKMLRINNMRIIIFFKVIFSFFLIYNIFWLYTNHPFQNNFFNFLAGDKPHRNYEVDYWGLSNKFVLEKIINEDNRKLINVSMISDTSLSHNINILTEEQKQKVNYVVDIDKSDYIINNNIFFRGDFRKVRKILSNFDVYYELFVDGTLVTTIYKRRYPI